MLTLDELLRTCAEQAGNGIYLLPGVPPVLRTGYALRIVVPAGTDPEASDAWIASLPPTALSDLETSGQTTFERWIQNEDGNDRRFLCWIGQGQDGVYGIVRISSKPVERPSIRGADLGSTCTR